MTLGDRREPFQLAGTALSEARTIAGDVHSGLLALLDAMYRARTGRSRAGDASVKHVVVTFGSSKICFFDDDWNCIECWEDPPGVSRPCNGEDSMSPGAAPPITVIEP